MAWATKVVITLQTEFYSLDGAVDLLETLDAVRSPGGLSEAKASVADYQRDDKWQEYLPDADRFYFVVEDRFVDIHGTLAEEVGWLAVNHSGQVRVVEECPGHLEAKEPEATKWAIARVLARRIVFGF